MAGTINRRLLNNPKVVEEIQRHQWLESEKAGYDIGFDRASDDWLRRFSAAWIRYHVPKQERKTTKTTTKRGRKSKSRAVKAKKS